MKKKLDKNVLNESCFIMNISKTFNSGDGSHVSNSIPEDSKIPLQNTLTPPQSIASSPNNKIKSEQENSPHSIEDETLDDKNSPPLSSLGPGAEIKGKICHPIPSGSNASTVDDSESSDEVCRSSPSDSAVSGGRLTFFQEGKLLLELSHRSEQGSWVQVKSKTYWPPPSTTTTTTTIQHPLRHDTPTTHSDDCSSVNSSPWASEHIRKQLGPIPRTKCGVPSEQLFYLKRSPHIRDIRRKIRLKRKRNPFLKEVKECGNSVCVRLNHQHGSGASANSKVTLSDRKSKLERTIARLGMRSLVKVEEASSIRSIFERVIGECAVGGESASPSPPDPAFITPRKRYLRTLENDQEAHLRKKAHAGVTISGGGSVGSLPSSAQMMKHLCDSRLSPFPSSSPSSISSPSSSPVPSLYAASKSSNSCHNASSYSIDSLLSSEPSSSENSGRRGESFLRTLLKPDKVPPSLPRSSAHGKHGASLPVRDRSSADPVNHHHHHRPPPSKRGERAGSSHSKELLGDSKKGGLPERYDLSSPDLPATARLNPPHPFYLNPYLDPRYMVLQSLSASAAPSGPSFLPGAVSPAGTDMASAMAVAAAAAAGYPLNPLHLSALTAGLATGVYPPPSPTSHFGRSPNPNRASPLSLPHTPSPKLSPAPPNLPLSPHFRMAGSPREVWTPSSLPGSPHKLPNVTSNSPPPQDVPLNLSKPKRKF